MSTRTNKDEKTIWLQPWAKFIRKERMIRRVKPKVQRKELKAMENYFQALDPNQETANLCISSPVFTWKTVFESLYLSLICKCTCLTRWNYVLSADTVYGTLLWVPWEGASVLCTMSDTSLGARRWNVVASLQEGLLCSPTPRNQIFI